MGRGQTAGIPTSGQELCRGTEQEGIRGKKEIIISYSPAKLLNRNERMAFNCGYLFLQEIYNGWDLTGSARRSPEKGKFQYDLNEILSKAGLHPDHLSGKLGTWKFSGASLSQYPSGCMTSTMHFPSSRTRADFIRRSSIRTARRSWTGASGTYDCTNYYFEIEQEDDFHKYGKSKRHQPSRSLGWGCSWTMTAFPSHSAPSRKPEQAADSQAPGGKDPPGFRDRPSRGLHGCLSSTQNRKFNDIRSAGGESAFITTQSIKSLPDFLQEYALGTTSWHLAGDEREYDITKLDDVATATGSSTRTVDQGGHYLPRKKWGEGPEQRLIVSFSIKYRDYLRSIRDGQVRRARKIVDNGAASRRGKARMTRTGSSAMTG